MNQTSVLLAILAMAVVTYVPRVLPMVVLSSRQLPPLIEAWLRQVPVAVLGALVLQALMPNGGPADVGPAGLYAVAAITTLVVARKTRSLLGAVGAGVTVVALARLGLG